MVESRTLDLRSVFFRKQLLGVGLLLTTCWILVALLRDTIPQVSNLYASSLPATPYLVPEHAGLLYLLMPLVVLASLILLWAPGVLVAMVISDTKRISVLAVKGFGLAFVIHFVSNSLLKFALGRSLDSNTFVISLFAANVLGLALVAYRARCGSGVSWPATERLGLRRVGWFLVLSYLPLVLLLPVFFWQDLNPDGVEALLLGRSLAEFYLPRIPVAPGVVGFGLGMIAQAYPIHWFVMLYGPVDVAARLPLLFHLPALFYGIIAFAEWRSERRLVLSEEVVIALALAGYTVTLSYNAGYHAYFSDIAMPAAFESLTVFSMLACAYFLWTKERFWFLIFALLSCLARPTGLLFLIMLAAGVYIADRKDYRSKLQMLAVAIGMCVIVVIVYEKVFAPWASISSSTIQAPSASILHRLRYLTLDDFSRLLFLLVPAGILPGLSLLTFRWQDQVGRSLTIATVLYFLFFYILAFITLHHFAPAMILPLVVFWRIVLQRSARKELISTAMMAAFVSIFLSLPRNSQIDRTVRLIGQKTQYLIGDYDDGYTNVWQAFKHKDVLYSLFSGHWEVTDPSTELLGSPGVIVHYSSREKTADSNYIVQPIPELAPAGFTKIADDGYAAVYVKDLAQWESDRYQSLSTDFESPVYDISRETTFKLWGVPAGNYTIDLMDLVPSQLASRLGALGIGP